MATRRQHAPSNEHFSNLNTCDTTQPLLECFFPIFDILRQPCSVTSLGVWDDERSPRPADVMLQLHAMPRCIETFRGEKHLNMSTYHASPLSEYYNSVPFERSILRRMCRADVAEHCDLRVVVNHTSFNCHRAILCGVSDVFRCMLGGNWLEKGARQIRLTFLSPVAFQAVFDFIYMGKLTVSPRTVLEVAQAAKVLMIPAMDKAIRNQMLGYINESNVFEVGSFSWLFDDEQMQDKCESIICERFEEVTRTQGFLNQTYQNVFSILGADNLSLRETEASVLDAIVRWVEFRPLSRMQHFSELLSLVRFEHIAQDELSKMSQAIERSIRTGFAPGPKILEAILPHQRRLPMTTAITDQNDDLGDQGTRGPLSYPNISSVPRQRRQRIWKIDEAPELNQDAQGPRFRASRRCVRNIRFDFVVRNVSSFHQGMGEESINSPWYKCGGGLLWRLELYPSGTGDDGRGYFSAFLRCCNDAGTDDFTSKASFSIFVVEQDFGNHVNVFQATKVFTGPEPCWGKTKFLKLRDLHDPNQALIDHVFDSLVIGATVTW